MYLSRSPFGTLMKFETLLSLNSFNTEKKNIQIHIYPSSQPEIPIHLVSIGFFLQRNASILSTVASKPWLVPCWSFVVVELWIHRRIEGVWGGLGIPEMVHNNSIAARNLAKNSIGRRNPSQILVTTINCCHFLRDFRERGASQA